MYLACAPKSNATYAALNKAIEDVKSGRTLEVPAHLRDAHYKGAAKLGHGTDYQYPHSHEGHHVVQDYLPAPRIYYEPSQEGWEAKIAERLAHWRGKKRAAQDADRPAPRTDAGRTPHAQ